MRMQLVTPLQVYSTVLHIFWSRYRDKNKIADKTLASKLFYKSVLRNIPCKLSRTYMLHWLQLISIKIFFSLFSLPSVSLISLVWIEIGKLEWLHHKKFLRNTEYYVVMKIVELATHQFIQFDFCRIIFTRNSTWLREKTSFSCWCLWIEMKQFQSFLLICQC